MKALLFGIALAAAQVSPSPAPSPSVDPLAELERQLEATARVTPAVPLAPHRHELQYPRPAPVRHVYPIEHEHPAPHRHERTHDLWEPFREPFIVRAMEAGVLAGFVCAWLGVFVVLRRMVFVGIALAQVASAAVALAVFMGWDPITLALLATLSFSALSGLARVRGWLNPEARIGVVYVLAGSIAVVLLAKSGSGEAEQLEMLQGSLLTIPLVRLRDLGLVATVVAVLQVFGYKKLVAVSFDPLFAHVAGVRVWLWNLLLFLTLGAGISISIQSCGLLLVFGYLVLPAATGLVAGLRLPGVFAVAVISQAVATVSGLWLAYEIDTPPGPTIVIVMCGLLALAAASRLVLSER